MSVPKKSLGRGLNTLISGSLKSAITAPVKKNGDTAAANAANAPEARPSVATGSNAAASANSASRAPAAAQTKAAVPAPTSAAAAEKIASPWQEIAVHKIIPARGQSRRDFNDQEIAELAESIQSVGLIQPIVVRKVAEGYELIAGERRLRAFKKLGIKHIPAHIKGETSDEGAVVMTLIENLQRKDLNPVEEAVGYATLMRDYKLTQESVAERVGKPRATIANSVRLLALDREIQGFLAKGMLGAGHAKVLLSLDDEALRSAAARRIMETGASVRMAEEIVKKIKNSSSSASTRTSAATATAAEVTAAIADVEKRLTSSLNTSVRVKHGARQGKIIIEYYGNDDLRRILEKIGIS